MITDTRKLSTEQQELIRQQTIELRRKGKSFLKVGVLFNIHPDTVGHCSKRYQEGSQKALVVKKRGPKYMPCRLTCAEEQIVIKAISDHMPGQFKLGFALWARPSLAQLIKRFWGIDIPVRTIGDFLKRWGCSPQKSVKKAWEQNPVKLDASDKEEYPQIKARAKQENVKIFWGDQTGIKNSTQHSRCDAPKGKTPVQPIPRKLVSLNMISAIANQAEVRFILCESTINAKVLIIFFRTLIEYTLGKVFLILDDWRKHSAKKVKRWLANRTVKRYLEVFFLPVYSPEPNPDQYLNCD